MFLWRALLKETDNMMWNLLSPLNWFHYGTSNYKSTMWKARERQEGRRFGPFYLAGTQDVSLQYHSISPEWLISCGSLEKKITISTGMYGHLKPYFNCSLYNSVKSGPEAVCSFSSHMFTLNFDVTKALQKVSLRPGYMTSFNHACKIRQSYNFLAQVGIWLVFF